MDFTTAVKTCFRKYATFSGRAARSEFWWFVLFLLLANIALMVIDRWLFGWGMMGGSYGPGMGAGMEPGMGPGFGMSWQMSGGPLGTLFSLGTIVPTLAVAARRLHDTGRSGWWQLLMLIPLIGAIILLVWYVQRGESGSNAYGEAPTA